ncbi:MAG: SIMPL domain-containing protein [Pyrinomonadaceae bacterium]|nr:SIMPL domain-containing protein [Pyrinomonadaceae bacterium]
MKKNVFIAFLLALLLGISATAFYFSKLNVPKLTRVTVTGESQSQIPPDNAVVTFSVMTQGKQAVEAQQENARKTESVIKSLEALTANYKVEIKTNDYSLQPEQNYRYEKMPNIIGYEAKNTVTVITPNLNQVGALIDAATKAGANSVEGISFILREDSPAQGNGLGIATRQAMAKAEAIAQSLNGKIYRVVEAQEGGGQIQGPVATDYGSANTVAKADYKMAYSTTIKSGSLTVHSNILLIVEVETK